MHSGGARRDAEVVSCCLESRWQISRSMFLGVINLYSVLGLTSIRSLIHPELKEQSNQNLIANTPSLLSLSPESIQTLVSLPPTSESIVQAQS